MKPDAHDGLRVGAAFFGAFVLACLGVLVGMPVLLILAVVFGWSVFCSQVAGITGPVGPEGQAGTMGPPGPMGLAGRDAAASGARRAARDSQ